VLNRVVGANRRSVRPSQRTRDSEHFWFYNPGGPGPRRSRSLTKRLPTPRRILRCLTIALPTRPRVATGWDTGGSDAKPHPAPPTRTTNNQNNGDASRWFYIDIGSGEPILTNQESVTLCEVPHIQVIHCASFFALFFIHRLQSCTSVTNVGCRGRGSNWGALRCADS
jgi:hypothetical protein